MRKILIKQIFVNLAYAIFILIVCCVICFALDRLFGSSEPMILAEMNENDGWDWMMIFYFMVFQNHTCRLSDAVFLMPISGKERIQMVKTLFMVTWLGYGAFIWIMFNLNGIVQLVTTGNLGNVPFIEGIVQLVVMLSSMYLLCYMSYFSTTDNLISIACFIISCFQSGFYVLLGDIILADGLKGLIVIGIICAVFWVINGWFHKNYFNRMAQFYADYESSRKLDGKKVSA